MKITDYDSAEEDDWFCIAFFDISFNEPETLIEIVEDLVEIASAKVETLMVLRKGKDVRTRYLKLAEYLQSVYEDTDNSGFSVSDGKIPAQPNSFKIGYFRYPELDIRDLSVFFRKDTKMMNQLGLVLDAVLNKVSCKYGFGLSKSWSTRPDFFVAGFPLGHDSPEHVWLGQLIWRDRYKFDKVVKKPLKQYENGRMYGLFELNVFSQIHMTQVVSNSSVCNILTGAGVRPIEAKQNCAILLTQDEIKKLVPKLIPVFITD